MALTGSNACAKLSILDAAPLATAALALTFVLCAGDAQATHYCGTEPPQNDPHECTERPRFIINLGGQVEGEVDVEEGQGTVEIESGGSVDAKGADSAIRGNDKTEVIVEVPEDDVTEEGFEERVKGPIVGVPEVVVRPVDEQGTAAGEERTVPLVDGKPSGLPTRAACDGADRCRLYEALPSALLAMNGLPTYGERMTAARDGNGGWARIDGAGGKWKAKSATQPNAAFDFRRYGVQAGVDFAVGADGRFGVSVRGLQGSAKLAGSGGEVDLSGVGAGAHGTAFLGDGFHVDAQAMATWYDVKLTSDRMNQATRELQKEVLKDGAKASGFALGVEVGRRTDVGDGLTVTPGVGLTWSDVSLDFVDTVDSGGARVSVEDARSLAGRAGLRVEARMEDSLRLSGSVEATHEFSEDRMAKVGDESLKTTEAKRTGVRVGFGGARSWEEGRYALRAALGYAARGSGNGEFDGGLNFALRF